MRDVVKIETATEPRFQELFVAAMALPARHRTVAAPGDAGRRCPTDRTDATEAMPRRARTPPAQTARRPDDEPTSQETA